MIILLNKPIECDRLCKIINRYLARESKNIKDLSKYALTFSLSEIKDPDDNNKLTEK